MSSLSAHKRYGKKFSEPIKEAIKSSENVVGNEKKEKLDCLTKIKSKI